MNALVVLAIIAGIIHGILIDGTWWKIYGILVALYLLFVLIYTKRKENPKRKTLLLSTWGCKYSSKNDLSLVARLTDLSLVYFRAI